GEQAFEVPFIHCNNLIQEISSAAFDPTLSNAVLPRTLIRGPDWCQTHGPRRDRDFPPVFCIPIEDQKPGTRPKRKRLPQLLDDPRARGMAGDVEVQNASTIMADDEKAVEHAERDRRNREINPSRQWLPGDFEERRATGWLGSGALGA